MPGTGYAMTVECYELMNGLIDYLIIDECDEIFNMLLENNIKFLQGRGLNQGNFKLFVFEYNKNGHFRIV
jgi:hypothetical protein